MCWNLLRSIGSEATCKTDSAGPMIIFPAKHNNNEILKQLFNEEGDISSDGICSEASDDDCDDDDDDDRNM